MTLAFAPGTRPVRDEIAALADGASGFAISLDPGGSEPVSQTAGPGGDWLELVGNGLTFDLTGLAPGRSAELPEAVQAYGLAPDFDVRGLEGICLRPGPHISAGGAMIPVVRSLAIVAAQLAQLDGVRAIAWHAARCWTEPAHFRTSIERWINGGPFPALGLASIAPMPDGGLQSQGMALFTGQELRLEPELVSDRAAAAKVALRLMHWMVETGTLREEERLTAPDGLPLRLEPSENGRFVRAWRG